eukprot:363694-Chlamydomonas_euryale.AAC.22
MQLSRATQSPVDGRNPALHTSTLASSSSALPQSPVVLIKLRWLAASTGKNDMVSASEPRPALSRTSAPSGTPRRRSIAPLTSVCRSSTGMLRMPASEA